MQACLFLQRVEGVNKWCLKKSGCAHRRRQIGNHGHVEANRRALCW